MTILWTNETAAEAVGGKAQGNWQATRVEIDSRRVQPGDLFIALKGERLDGHKYVAEALQKGAAAAMVQEAVPAAPAEKLFHVADTQKALEAMGIYARRRSRAKIVGITGSVGKTSSKEMLRLALSAHGATHANHGNFNNHIGTPLTLANLPPDTDFAVLEMGMNHAGEIAPLTRMAQPHIAAITNIEAVHMEFFPSLEAIAHAKAEIFEGVAPGGAAILNRDNAMYGLLADLAAKRGLKAISFGAGEKADCRLLDYRSTVSGCEISASLHGKTISYRLGAIGKHWATTSLLVLAITHALGLDDNKTAPALAAFGELEGRGRLLPIALAAGEALLIDDSYNASPASMRAAFVRAAELAQSRPGRKLAALGDMLELGDESPALHAALAKDLEQSGFDKIFTAGTLMKNLHNGLPPAMRGENVAQAMELLPLLLAQLQPADMLLVKGSHGSHIYKLAAALATTSPSPRGRGQGEGVS